MFNPIDRMFLDSFFDLHVILFLLVVVVALIIVFAAAKRLFARQGVKEPGFAQLLKKLQALNFIEAIGNGTFRLTTSFAQSLPSLKSNDLIEDAGNGNVPLSALLDGRAMTLNDLRQAIGYDCETASFAQALASLKADDLIEDTGDGTYRLTARANTFTEELENLSDMGLIRISDGNVVELTDDAFPAGGRPAN